MIITWQIGLRIAAILLVAVVLQASFFAFLRILGATPDVMPVVVTAIGLMGGAVTGAVCGFLAGLALDSVLLQTLGMSSLVLLSVGYLAGRYREGFEIDSRTAPALLAAGLTALATAGFTVLQITLGVETSVSLLLLREIVVKALLAFLLAFPVYAAVRFALRPALVDYVPKPRRRILGGRRRAGRPSARRRSRAIQGGVA
jgi:rod shape-determining protein MreD